MNDLISRQAAIDAINKAFERVFAWDGTSPLGDKVLENVPSAQPEPIKINIDDFNKEDLERFKKELGNTPITVLPAQPEIIRCKDCKYWMRAYLSISGKHGCNVMRDYTAPDDYCFKAER